MLAYILQVTGCSVFLYSYYHLVLRNERFHQYNRFYLLALIPLSILLPLLRLTPPLRNETVSGMANKLNQLSITLPEVIVTSHRPAPLTRYAVPVLFGLITLIFLIRIAIALMKIIRLKQRHTVKDAGGFLLIECRHPDVPFSFFNWIFWDPRTDPNTGSGKQLLDHETYHVRQRHSWDLLFIEFTIAFMWFNPIFYVIRKELKATHEFLADRYAANQNNKYQYAELLVLHAMSVAPSHKLINPFFTNQLKRRITMLTKNNKPAFQYLRKLMVLPFLAVATLLFSFTYLEHSIAAITKTVAADNHNTILNNKKENPPEPMATALVVRELSTAATKPKIKQQPVISRLPEREIRIPVPSLENIQPIIVASSADTIPAVKKEPEVFTKVEKEASYPGDWRAFLMGNLNTAVATNNKAPVGTYQAVVQFIVSRDGSVSDIKCIKDPGFGVGQEAIRVIKLSGKWNPAEQNHRTVIAYRKQPITFVVNQ